jgi:pimeloyl-ACP methyl ester carboxylesterase
MPFVDANGLRFHYQEMGTGRVTVLLHGFLGNLSAWFMTATQLAGRERRAILWDLRAHGKSERVTTGFDLATLDRDLGAVLEVLAPGERVDLVGFSYGALIALHHVMRHPERAARLVLVESPLPPGRREDLEQYLTTDPQALIAGLPESIRKIATSNPVYALRLAGIGRFLAHKTSLIDDVCDEAALSEDALRALATPTLCLYGSRSELREVGERLARTLPGGELRLLDGSHWLQVERAQELAAEVGAFLCG